jgi:hypothetical protein
MRRILMLIAVIAGNVQSADPATLAQMFKGSLKGKPYSSSSSSSVSLIDATVMRKQF